MSKQSPVQIRLCWVAAGGVIGAGEWQNDTPDVRESMRAQIQEGEEMAPPIPRWIDVKDANPRGPVAEST